MNYISIQSSQDVIEHYGIKGMRWGIKSRHKELKDLYSSYKESDRHASNTLPAVFDQNHPHYKLGMAAQHQSAADKALYKSHVNAYLYREKSEKSKKKGKQIKQKVAKKLKKKIDDNYDLYLGHRSLATKYYNSYTGK